MYALSLILTEKENILRYIWLILRLAGLRHFFVKEMKNKQKKSKIFTYIFPL